MPSYSRYFHFGDYTFPLGTSVESILRGKTIGSQKMARSRGMAQTVGYRNGLQVELNVPVYKGPLDTSEHRPRMDDLRAILAQAPSRLFVYDDRYWPCVECVSEPEEIVGARFGNIHVVRATLVGPDDIAYSTATETDTWNSPSNGATRTITPTGEADTYPIFTITVGGSGLVTLSMELENTTTEESFTLSGSVTGGSVIIVNCDLKRVTIAGVDRIDLFDLLFMKFLAGGNDMSLTLTSGTLTSIVTTWQPRYRN